MNKQLAGILDKVKTGLKKLSSKQKKIILLTVGLVIVFSVAIAVVLNNKPYEVLFTQLNEEEASEIMGKLREGGVDYKYQTEGTILVPKDEEQKWKAQLVYEGYPKSGFTYDVFKNNIDMMTTDFEKDKYAIFDLETRMGAIIRLWSGVKDAKVTIAPGQESKYVLNKEDVKGATASVLIIMKDGGSPTKEQVSAAQRLVSTSVLNLEMKDVSVIDGNGLEVSVSGESEQTGANKLKLELEKEIDSSIEGKILNLLSPIFGLENVRVSVKSTVDVDKKIREITTNTPPIPGSTKGVESKVESEQEVVKDGAAVGGVPGATSDADIPIYNQIETDGTETYVRTQNSVNYLMNQLKEQAQIDAGSLEDLTISVVVNGTNFGTVQKVDLQGMIAKAAGIAPAQEAEKISIVATPFFKPTETAVPDEPVNGNKNWIIIGTIVFGSLLLLSIILIILRKRRKARLAQELLALSSGMEPKKREETKVPKKPEISEQEELLDISNEKGMELKNKIRDFSKDNPEIAAQLLKVWLKGGEDNG